MPQTQGSRLDRHAAAVAVGLAALNLALKLPGLAGQGLWFDEAVSIRTAAEPFDLARRMAADASPPLYGILLSAWMGVFGTSLEGARSLSAVASALTAPALFALGRRFAGAGVGLVAALLFTGSRVQLHFAHEARPYALVGLVCVASFYAFLALWRTRSSRAAVGLAVLNAALLYTHYVAALAIAAQGVAALVAARAAPRAFRLCLASFAASALLFLPCAAWLWLHWPPPMAGWDVPPTPARLLFVLTVLAGSREILLAGAILLVAAAVGDMRRRPAHGETAALADPVGTPVGRSPSATPSPPPALVFALWALLPVAAAWLISQVVPIFLHRYLLYASLGLQLLLALAACRLRVAPAARAAVAAALVGLSLLALWREPILRPDWRGAVAIARAARRPGALVVVSPPHQLLPFAFHHAPAAFADRAGMVRRLADERVVALPLAELLAAAPEIAADRLVLAISTQPTAAPADLESRLATAGFAVAERHELSGVEVIVADRPR